MNDDGFVDDSGSGRNKNLSKARNIQNSAKSNKTDFVKTKIIE